MPRPASPRAARAALTFCLLAASLALAGCASKNPLMDDAPAAAQAPAASASSTAPQAAAASAPTSAAGATSATASANSGVQTTHNRRFLGIFSPYRVDIQQGNFVSQEMLAQLKPGMTPEQVRFALGTPLLNDMFHANRWDYLFRLQKRNGDVTTSRVTVIFENQRMVRYEGGNLPSEQDYLARIAGTPPKSKPEPNAPQAPSAAKE